MLRHVLAALAFAGAAGCAMQAPPAPDIASASRSPITAPQWNAAALAEAIAYVAAHNSTAFLVIEDGRVVAEHRWPLGDSADDSAFRASFTHGVTDRGDLLEDVASQQKSFIAILAGVAVDKGLLDVAKPVAAYLGAGWSKASPEQESAITVLNLLEMNSGLTEQFTFEAPAGARFFYNTPVYAMLKPVLEKASGQSLDQLTRDWLTAPLGMADTSWRQRPGALAGSSGNATGLVTTARDVARMGQLVLDRGKTPDGRRVISEAELNRMLQPTATNPAYGRLWWLNGGDYVVTAAGNRVPGALIPTAPRDMVAAQGAQERRLHVVPSRQLIVVRMGRATGATDFNSQLWFRLSKAMR